ncbi:hypothetical protein BT63DRAFT_460981 [Microthyrium microscopicum]|uniref:Uncharacterized protein n=1 Tax=Microthyrium microscopicum TaxID=703497 RepID=A0A6A6TX01_9PEZI|nr:hypothetical protein BT63DRAFT_460981 [Microthyrium microscopicum]
MNAIPGIPSAIQGFVASHVPQTCEGQHVAKLLKTISRPIVLVSFASILPLFFKLLLNTSGFGPLGVIAGIVTPFTSIVAQMLGLFYKLTDNLYATGSLAAKIQGPAVVSSSPFSILQRLGAVGPIRLLLRVLLQFLVARFPLLRTLFH